MSTKILLATAIIVALAAAVISVILLTAQAAPAAFVTVKVSRTSLKPTLDGVANDSIWLETNFVNISVKGASGNRVVRTKALHDENNIYILTVWDDETKNVTHKPWVWNGFEYVKGFEKEDRISFLFEITGFSLYMCSRGGNLVVGIDYECDLWHWKADRGRSGYADDQWMNPAGGGEEEEDPFRLNDEGNPAFVTTQKPTAYEGDKILQFNPGTPTGSRADIKAVGTWGNGFWTVEFERKLDTRHLDDVKFESRRSYKFGIAVFDHAAEHYHSVSDVLVFAIE